MNHSADLMPSLAFYARQSPLTDPGASAGLLDALPGHPLALTRVVQGLLVHAAAKRYFALAPVSGTSGWGVRAVADTLARIRELDDAPLTKARPPRRRLLGNCRSFAVLLVAMLRHQGVPARKRAGFAAYLPGQGHPEYVHEVPEIWDATGACWRLVEPQDLALYFTVTGRAGRTDIDPLDLRAGDAFHLAGDVWRACRAGRADPNAFQVDATDRGMALIRSLLLQDLDGLNKVELLSNDWWHELMTKPEAAVTADELALLDRVAELTTHADAGFDELRALYADMAYAQAVRDKLRTLGLG